MHCTIDSISSLDIGKNEEMGNSIDNINEKNTFSNNIHIANLYANTYIQNSIYNPGLFPTGTVFQNNHTCKEMLSHHNHIVIGCFKDSFQTIDTNNLSAVFQALKDLNIILDNRAPRLPACYGLPLEP